MARRRAPAPASPPSTHLERRSAWAGLHSGDSVDVLDERERGATWRFVAIVTNLETDATWVEVVGGREGEQRRRSIRTDQLYPHNSIRGGVPGAASFDSAPRLPL